MFAGQQDRDERLEIPVGQRHVGCPERRHHRESGCFEVGAPVDDDEWESLEARLAQRQDLDVVGRHQRRDTEPIPRVESATETSRIRTQDLRVEFIAAHDQQRITGNRQSSNTRDSIGHASTLPST